MQRVECLYRVSTKGQVDHDDIPMQRIECRKFAEEQGWTIIKELCEKRSEEHTSELQSQR